MLLLLQLRKGASASDSSWRRRLQLLLLLLLGKLVSLVSDVPEAGEFVTVVVVGLKMSDPVGGVEGRGGGTLLRRGVLSRQLFSALTRAPAVFSPCGGGRRGVPLVTLVPCC